MTKQELRRLIKTEIKSVFRSKPKRKINEINLSRDQIQRFEGTANMKNLKTLHAMLRLCISDWESEGFEKEDGQDYVNWYIEKKI